MKALQDIASSMARQQPAGAAKEPKYKRLYGHFVDAIERGQWKPGDRLPPEVELAKEIPASLGTIQKALGMLAEQGIVVRQHGNGTFIAGALTTSHHIKNFKFLDEDGETILPIYSRLLSVKRVGTNGPWAAHFPGTTRFVFIARLFSVNLEFHSFAEAYLPEPRFGQFLNMTGKELDGSALTYMLGKHFNAPALKISNRMAQVKLPAPVCHRIEVAKGTIGIEWELIGRSYRDEPIFYQRFFVPPTNRKIEINV